MSAHVKPDPIFTIEGRIGGRWWAWQRFRERDDAARELAQLAAERRFDGVRLILTVPGRDRVPPLVRELVVIDGDGVRRPGERHAGEGRPGQGPKAPPAAPAYRPLAARAIEPPPRPAPRRDIDAPFFSARRLRADEILAELAARATAAKRVEEPPLILTPAAPHPPADSPSEPSARLAPALPEFERMPEPYAPEPRWQQPAQEHRIEPVPASEIVIETAQPSPAADADLVEPVRHGATEETLTGEAGPFVPPPTAGARRHDPLHEDDPPYLTAEDRIPEEEPGDYLIDPAIEDEERPPPRKRRVFPRQLAYALGAGMASLLLAVASYETTRLVFGLPDLLDEARIAVAGLTAGPEKPIVLAARHGKADEVAKLLRGGFSPNSEDAQGVPALLVAARAGHTNIVRLLLDAGADPNLAFGYGETPMLIAAREGLQTTLELMQAKGGQVNGRGGADLCATPLLAASAAGKLEAVNFLLAKGASFDVLPGCRQGPLDVAVRYPRVREALEVAYQRRQAAGSTQLTQASLPTQTVPARPAPAMAPPVPLTAPGKPDAPADPRAYAAMMYGMTWRETLAAVKATAKECREVGRRYVACELKVKPWLDDIETVEAWFDRADGDRFVSIEQRSVELVDYSATRDGAAVRSRFDQIRRAIDQRLPQGMKPIVVRQAPNGLPFFESLKPEVNAGEFSAFWSDDGRRRPAAIQLKLTGIDQRKGYYRLVVSNPMRSSQQAAAGTK